jgi:NAD-dependent deacetylase
MKTIFFTGAGLSADSGVPTFRGPGGIYKNRPVEQWLTGENYSREPARSEIDAWYDTRRHHLAGCEPNAAHRGIAEYALRHPDTVVMTQNVDDLLERAGLPADRILHLHGSIVHLRCRRCGHRIHIGYARDPDQPCPATGCSASGLRGHLRTDVVLFGEEAPLYQTMWRELAAQRDDDALVVIGTHGSVIAIGETARRLPGLRILNNLHPSDALDESAFDQVIRAPAADAFPRILDLLAEWRTAR